MKEKILIVGGAGYVGSMLEKLLKDGYKVKIFDLFIYDIKFEKNENLELVKGDVRNTILLEKILNDVDHVIHLMCILMIQVLN